MKNLKRKMKKGEVEKVWIEEIYGPSREVKREE
jgi:hypothetical protein